MASKTNTTAPTMNELIESSQLFAGSGEYLDLMYESYLQSPSSVSESWQKYFANLKSLEKTTDNSRYSQDQLHTPIKEYFKKLAKEDVRNIKVSNLSNDFNGDLEELKKQAQVNKLIVAYRRFGHRHAKVDPLGLTVKEELPILDLDYYNFTQADLNKEFIAGSLVKGGKAKLSTIIETLQDIYCSTIGYQYQYITTHEELIWLQEKIESRQTQFHLSDDIKKNILQQLTAAEGLEKYLGTKYVGQKRFSLEGGESFIVIMDELIQRSGKQGIKEIVIAMAHRGRLNVLVNTLGKAPADLFAEFEGKKKNDLMSGDVKYHQGFSSDLSTEGGPVHLSLAFNPSHLEIVSPVTQGSVRARQDRRTDTHKNEVLLISIHGDSAFAGQGVVMETLNMSQLRGFSIGGTVHIVINNQVGFTTSETRDTRSTRYCTDVAKMIEAPVFHVNGDDPESVLWVTQLALDYKHKFKKDVIIDLICYRRHGHNEADEPSATQPVMYQIIKNLPTTREQYAKKLIVDKVITEEQDSAFIELYRNKLDQGDVVVAHVIGNSQEESPNNNWYNYLTKDHKEPFNSSYDLKKLISLAKKITDLPKDFVLQSQVKRIIDNRLKMANAELPIDWGCAELLAYATLLEQGFNLRLCGQDSGRGTFAHRHAVLHDQVTSAEYNSLDHLFSGSEQGLLNKPRCAVIDSFLSEEAVLAFEYGYSTTDPKTLTIWEAQFGDFVNGAQVVIDQFISSCEQKWGRLSGLVLLLPHGYEGMGPEHSSARLERFLQLCAEQNMQVCIPTTPAQVFHMFRRQMLRHYRRPLIVMSPKGFLRHKLAVSSLEELANGHFELIIPEQNADITYESAQRVVLCSGKVYYDLLAEREASKNNKVAIIRVEQLYPFPEEQLTEVLAKYKNAKEVVWCQEEPKNQGAWYCSSHHMYVCLGSGQKLTYVGRESSSAPAVGYHKLHLEQQINLVQQALNISIDKDK